MCITERGALEIQGGHRPLGGGRSKKLQKMRDDVHCTRRQAPPSFRGAQPSCYQRPSTSLMSRSSGEVAPRVCSSVVWRRVSCSMPHPPGGFACDAMTARGWLGFNVMRAPLCWPRCAGRRPAPWHAHGATCLGPSLPTWRPSTALCASEKDSQKQASPRANTASSFIQPHAQHTHIAHNAGSRARQLARSLARRGSMATSMVAPIPKSQCSPFVHKQHDGQHLLSSRANSVERHALLGLQEGL